MVALALQQADTDQRHTLHAVLSNPNLTDAGADRIRQVLIATGARDKVENMITTRCTQALRALEAAPLPLAATAALRKLADAATARAS